MPANDPATGDGPYALSLSEIRLQIFKELDARNLMCAALVCKAWTWEAIDTRWRNHPIQFSAVLRPLLKGQGKEYPPPWVSNIHDAPEVSAKDWVFYQLHYAGKVTHLILDMEWGEDFNGELERLMEPHDAPICPNLVSLEYGIGTTDDGLFGAEDEDHWSPLLRLLVGHNLANVILTIRDVEEHVAIDNVRALVRIAPQLHNLVIINCAEFSINYSAFHQLKSLEVNGFISHAGWRSLAHCPGLERIVLYKDDEIMNESQRYSITFPRLKSLYFIERHWFRPYDYGFIVELIQNTTMPVPRTLRVRVQASDELREAAKNEMVGYVRGRSPMLRKLVLNR
ncbi:hypothetical protein FRB93_007190 [Tulasnella sp. JGI-2019a]|nr:hypothetical protein FRB93_007190 [Tulasnella sp. JGI-2019a]